jgi:hypothetical protein
MIVDRTKFTIQQVLVEKNQTPLQTLKSQHPDEIKNIEAVQECFFHVLKLTWATILEINQGEIGESDAWNRFYKELNKLPVEFYDSDIAWMKQYTREHFAFLSDQFQSRPLASAQKANYQPQTKIQNPPPSNTYETGITYQTPGQVVTSNPTQIEPPAHEDPHTLRGKQIANTLGRIKGVSASFSLIPEGVVIGPRVVQYRIKKNLNNNNDLIVPVESF